MADKHDSQDHLEALKDTLLYAPLGLVYEYEEVLPRLVRRGKSQVQLAKMLTKAARNNGLAEQKLADAAETISDLLARGFLEIGHVLGLAPNTSTNGTRPSTGSEAAEPEDASEERYNAPESANIDGKSTKAGGTQGNKRKAAKPAKSASSKPRSNKPGSAKSKSKSTKKPPSALPIAGYDQLSAKDLLPLLGDLSSSQRKVVKTYEANNRARKTVLTKLDRLEK